MNIQLRSLVAASLGRGRQPTTTFVWPLPDCPIVKCYDVTPPTSRESPLYIRTLSAVAAHNATEREVKTTRLAELPWSRDDCCTTRVSGVGQSTARPTGHL